MVSTNVPKRLSICQQCENQAPALVYPTYGGGWPPEAAQICGHMPRVGCEEAAKVLRPSVFVTFDGLPWVLGGAAFGRTDILDFLLMLARAYSGLVSWDVGSAEHTVAANVSTNALDSTS